MPAASPPAKAKLDPPKIALPMNALRIRVRLCFDMGVLWPSRLRLYRPDQLASFVVCFRNIRFRFVGSRRPRQLWRFAGIRLGKFVGKAHRNSRLFCRQSWLYPPLVVVQKVENCRPANQN